MPQSTETTRRLTLLPVEIRDMGRAVKEGDLPNPCYILWTSTCLIKLYANEEVNADIQVCNLSPSQTPDACFPYIYDGNLVSDDLEISSTGMCIDEETNVSYDLLRFGIDKLNLVDNSENWFTRLQYYIDY